MDTDVLNFINRFNPESEDIKNTFTQGCCYWFAFILLHRFYSDGAELMYDPTVNHFGTRISDRIYDITGDVTDKYGWVSWYYYSMEDEALRRRIIRDCINF